MTWRVIGLLGIAAVTAAVFAPSLSCGFVWDDDFNVVGNEQVRGFSAAQLRWMVTSVHLGHYHPLTWLSLALDHRLFGAAAWGYHLTNVLLHAANAGLVYLLVRALLERFGQGARAGVAVWGPAALGALVFAVHPLRVESVTWVTERRGLLCAFFSLLAVLAYLRGHGADRSHRGWLAAAYAAFALSLLAKGASMTMPLVLVVLDWYPLGRRAWGEKLPYLLLAALAAAAAAFAAQASGAMAPLVDHGAGPRVIQAAFGAGFYVWKTVWPVDLSPLYPIEGFVPGSASVLACAAAVAVITVVAVSCRSRLPAVPAAWACYLLVLAPVLGLAQSGLQVAADRYTYIAGIPLVVLAAAGLHVLLVRHAVVGRVGSVLALVVVLGLATLARAQVAVWRDAGTLWERVVRLFPESHDAWHNLGLGRLGGGDARSALVALDRAIALAPAFAQAYNSRGAAREATGDLPGALSDFDRAIALVPAWVDPYNNRGNVRLARGDVAGALGDYDHVLAAAPGHARARFNRALARERGRDVPGALADIDALLAASPDYAHGYATRVRYRAALGDLAGALADCDRALTLLPVGSADADTVRGYRATLAARLATGQRE